MLVLSPYPPYPPSFGAAARVYHLVRGLARQHEVTLLCFASPAERAELGPVLELCRAVHTVDRPGGMRRPRLYQLWSLVGRAYSFYAGYSLAMQRLLSATLGARRFDVVQIEFSQMAYYSLPTDVIRILDEHNVEHALLEQISQRERTPLRRLYAAVQSRKFRRDELEACRRMDAILTTSELDRAALAPHVGKTPIRVVPNGVDTTYFAPGGTEQPASLVFVGAMNYLPNADGAVRFCEEILPRVRTAVPEVTFAIVGREPPAWLVQRSHDGVSVTGTVPDVRPWMQQAAVFVVPLGIGSGTRLKILEALACGRAVVSTSLGCQGLEVTHGDDILIADTPAAFAETVVRCLRDPALRTRLGARGRALVERRYRWDVIGRELSDFHQELATGRRRDVTPEQRRWPDPVPELLGPRRGA